MIGPVKQQLAWKLIGAPSSSAVTLWLDDAVIVYAFAAWATTRM